MTTTTRVKATAYLVTAAYSSVLFVYGLKLPSMATHILGVVPLIVVGLFALLDNWLWKLPLVLKLLKQPLLDGTWFGSLTSYRRDSTDKKISSKHDVVVVIRQTLTTLSVTLISDQSKSRSDVATLVRKQSDDYVVQYQYRNDPKMEHRDQSAPHSGGALIEAGGSKPTELYGEYWTTRDTRGSYTLKRVGKIKVSAFDEGRELAKAEGVA